MEVGLPRKARLSQEWPWVSRWGGASVEASPRVSRGGEASNGSLPCESRGNQRELQDGGASVWASACEFR